MEDLNQVPTEIVFRSGDDSPEVSAEVLRQEFAGQLNTPCSLHTQGREARLDLNAAGIVLSMMLDRGTPTAVAEVAEGARCKHVADLCGVFRDLGWEFWLKGTVHDAHG